jgi:hypothetical protein
MLTYTHTYIHTYSNPDFAEMLLASAALDWTLGRFVEGIDTYSTAVSLIEMIK